MMSVPSGKMKANGIAQCRRIEGAFMAKSNQNVRHVVPNPAGGWDVKKGHAGRSSGHSDTQAEATKRAAEIVKNAGGGEVRIHGKDGKIRDADTIAPGNDPYPPRG